MSDASVRRTSYYLACHAFVARVDGVLVLLDSRTDDYLLVEARHASTFLGLLSRSAPASQAVAADAELSDLVAEMEHRGSIVRDLAKGKPLEIIEHVSTSREIPGPDIAAIPRIRPGHILSMVSAILTAAYLLRIRSLRSALAHVARLRRRTAARGVRGDPSDLVEIHNRLTPFFYGAKNMCLFNSLSMIIFLSKYGIAPAWRFGVKLKPFEAHCWVEDDQWLYNDQYARTWRYSPIMQA